MQVRGAWALWAGLGLIGCGSEPISDAADPGADGGILSQDAAPADAGDAGSNPDRDAESGPDLGPLDPWTPPAQVDWAPCTEPGLSGLECASLAVPLDHQAPRARIQLALARAPAEDPGRRIGVLLVNPGGPGGRSREFARQVRDSSLTLRRRFDIIGVDWRGVGGSEPVLNCASDDELDELRDIDPRSDLAAHQAWTDRFRQRCTENVGAEALGHLGVVDVARDMELVRQALGETELNFLGVSYGTLLGATFATLYPDSMRAFALDAVVSPSTDPRRFLEVRTQSEKEGLDDFFLTCPSTPGCWTPGGSAAQVQASTLAFLSMADDGTLALPDRILSASDARDAVAHLMGPGLYITLGEMIRGAIAGDPTLAFAVADAANGRAPDGSYSEQTVANLAISCRDRYGPGAIAAGGLEQALSNARTVDPRLGGWGFDEYRTCIGWPAPAELLPISAPDAPKLLLIGGEKDWWTALSLSADMRNALGNLSYLYESRGRGHGRWDRPPAANRVRDYLLDPSRNPDESSCLRVPFEQTVTATLTFDVPIRAAVLGAATVEVRAEADDRLLGTVTTTPIAANQTLTARVTIPSGGQPQSVYLLVSATGQLSEEVHFNAPRRGATRVPIALTTLGGLESVYSGLGLTLDPNLANVLIRALDCEGAAGSVVIETSSAAGSLYYSGLLDNRCVPDASGSRTDPICGSAHWLRVPPGDYQLGYEVEGVRLDSRPLPVRADVQNQLVLDPN